MRLSHGQHQPSKFRKYAQLPVKAFGVAWLLTDDFVHARVSEAANGIERTSDILTRGRFPVTRKRLAYAFLVGAPTIAPLVIPHCPLPVFTSVTNPLLNMFIWSDHIDHAFHCGGAGNSNTLCGIRLVFRMIRLPLLTLAASKFLSAIGADESQSSVHLEGAIYWGAVSLSLYLSSGASGFTSRVMDWARQKMEEIKLATATNATNFQATEPANNSSM